MSILKKTTILSFGHKDIVNKYINYFLIGYAFCLPISKAGVNFFEIIIILLWLYQCDWKNKFNQYKLNPFIMTFIIFILYSLISIFWASSISYGINYILKYRHFLLIFIIYNSLDKKYIKYLFLAFLSGMLISEIVSYGIFLELWTYKNISPADPSPFMSHTDYSIYLSFTAMVLIAEIFHEENINYKIFYFIFLLNTIIVLLINNGRTGQVAFIVALFVITILNIKNKIKAIFVSFVILLIIIIVAFNYSPNFQNRFNQARVDVSNMINKGVYHGSLSTRISLWLVGIDQITDKLTLGYGIGNEMNLIKKYSANRNWSVRELNSYADHHNMFITYGIQLGQIGLLLILIMFYFLYKLKFKTVKYKNLNYIFIIIFILWSMGGMTFHLMSSMTFFAFFAGIFNNISYLESQENKNNILGKFNPN